MEPNRTRTMVEWKPMTWEAFQRLSPEEQEEYLFYLTGNFKVGCTMIANELFHISGNTLSRYIKSRGLRFQMSRGGRIADVVLLNWKNFLATADDSSTDSLHRSSFIPGAVSGSPATGVGGATETVNSILSTMQEKYGDVRVTITIEPVR